jgi:hypothetical protein
LSAYDGNFRLTQNVLPSRYALQFELDFDNWTSKGHERIELSVTKPTRQIVLHAFELDITKATVDGANALESMEPHAEAQAVTLRFAREITPGQHTLEIDWNGGIRESLRGLYRSTRGEERYAATQFEAADARRAFPCFDEPEFKARFGQHRHREHADPGPGAGRRAPDAHALPRDAEDLLVPRRVHRGSVRVHARRHDALGDTGARLPSARTRGAGHLRA